MRRALLATALFALLVPLVALADDDPVITVPANMTVEAQNVTGATVTYTASAVDSHGNPVPGRPCTVHSVMRTLNHSPQLVVSK